MKKAYLLMGIGLTLLLMGCSSQLSKGNDAESLPIIKPFPGDYGKEMSVFFPEQFQNMLSEEKRIIENENKKYEEIMVDELLKGPVSSSLRKIIPEGTELLSVEVLGQIGYVNFNKSFLSNKLSEEEEVLMIYSVVNTLTQIDKISKVQILIEGERPSKSNYIEISEPLDSSYLIEKYPYYSPIKPINDYYSRMVNKEDYMPKEGYISDNYIEFIQIDSFKIKGYRFNKYSTNMRVSVDIEYKVKSESEYRTDTQIFTMNFSNGRFYIKEVDDGK